MKKILVGLVATVAASYTYAAAPTSAPTASTVAAPEASVSVPVEAVAPQKKKVSLSYVAENSIGSQAANKGNWEGNGFSLQHLGIGTDLGKDRKIQYRQYFYYNFTDAKRDDEWALGEHVVNYTDNTSFKIGTADVATAARLYLPGSEHVKDVGQYQLRVGNSAEQKFGKTTVEYALGHRFFWYTGNDAGQYRYRLIPVVEVSHEANRVFAPFANVFMDIRRNNAGTGLLLFSPGDTVGTMASNPDNDDRRLGVTLGSGVTVSKNISLRGYFETSVRSHRTEEAGNRLFDEDTQYYYLDISASL